LYQRRRCDERLRPWQVDAILDADAMARRIGLPLNQFVTIKWKWTALGHAIDHAPFMAGKKAMAEWFERRDQPMTLVYVHENPDGQFNTHILIHVPKNDREDFTAKLNDWFGPITDPAAIDIRSRDWPHAKYIVKGTDWATARRIGWYPKPQGTIPFKRAGGTTNIWRKGPDRFQARQHSAE